MVVKAKMQIAWKEQVFGKGWQEDKEKILEGINMLS